MTKLALLVLTILTLSACAMVNTRMKEYEGQHIDNAIIRLGSPTKITELSGGSKLYEWNKGTGVGGSASSFGKSTFVNVRSRSCNVRLRTDAFDIIREWSWDGDC